MSKLATRKVTVQMIITGLINYGGGGGGGGLIAVIVIVRI